MVTGSHVPSGQQNNDDCSQDYDDDDNAQTYDFADDAKEDDSDDC